MSRGNPNCLVCKGLGSVIKADCKTGQFTVKDCENCYYKSMEYYCSDTGVTLLVRETIGHLMSVVEIYNDDLKYRRLINKELFQQHLEEGIIRRL